MDEEIDWKEVARRALDHIDSLLLYVNYLEDSYPTEAMGFLVQVKEAIGDKTKPRMAGAIKPREPFFPLPRLNPPSADPGIPVYRMKDATEQLRNEIPSNPIPGYRHDVLGKDGE